LATHFASRALSVAFILGSGCAVAASWGAAAIPGVQPLPTTAVYAAGAENPCPNIAFADEQQAKDNYLACLPHDGYFNPGGGCGGTEHRFYENYRWEDNGDYFRNPNDYYPNASGKLATIRYTVRSVCPNYTISEDYSYSHRIVRTLICPDCTGFANVPQDYPPPSAPAVLPCNPGLACLKNGTCPASNPVIPDDGRKRQVEEDLALPSGVAFQRTYDSTSHSTWSSTGVIGKGWTHSFDRRLQIVEATTINSVMRFADRPHPEGFVLSGGAFLADADSKARLIDVRDASNARIGWDYVDGESESTERYDPGGRLVRVTTRAGYVHTLGYGADGRLATVTDPYGRILSLSHDAQGRLSRIVDASGAPYDYAYSASGNLQSVTYPPDPLGVRRLRVYHYEDASNPSFLTGITDENGWRFATYTYASGRVAETKHHASATQVANRYTFAYGASTTITDPLGTARVRSFVSVAGANRDAGVSQPCASCGSVASAMTYDANANVVSRTDFNGKKACYAYDLTRNLETARVEGLLAGENCAASIASPPNRSDVREVTTTWHPSFRLPATTTEPAPGGTRTTTFTYDPTTGDLLSRSTVAPKNDGTSATITRAQSWTYVSRGRVQTATDPNGRMTQYTYYPDNDPDTGKRGNLHTVTNPLGHVTTVTAYDLNGRPTAISDPNGAVTTMTYDARGRLVARSVAGETTAYAYDGVGQLTLVTLPDASTLSYLYDGAHRLTEIRDGLGNKIVYTLDGKGNRTAENVYDHAGVLKRTRSRVFNALNRLERELGAVGQTTQYGYDANGNRTSVTDPLGRTTVSAFDALGRLVQVTDPLNGATQYGYGGDLLVQVSDPRQLVTGYGYDGLGNQTKLASPDTGEATQTFDAAGNLLTRVDARGVTATHAYDLLNRSTGVVFTKPGAASETHGFEYDGLTTGTTHAKGRLTKVTDPSGEVRIAYTAAGRVASRTQIAGGTTLTLGYSYNPAGQLQTLTTPSGQQVGYGYLNNRVAAITVNGQTLLSGAVTLPFAQAGGWQWGNGLYTLRQYDSDGRPASWEFGNGATLLARTLAYDTASRITGISDALQASQNTGYGYDALDRLTSAQLGSPLVTTRQYGYDAVGNRTTATTDGLAATLTSSRTSNQLVALIGGPPAGLPVGATRRTFSYNLANRLASVGDGSATLASYTVNALGQRVAKTVGGTTTRFMYDDAGRLIGEYTASGALIQETIWLEDLPVATLRPTGGGGSPTPINVYYVHADHLGSPRAVTRPADNAIMWRWDNSDPFGTNAANENPQGAGTFSYHLRFPGQYYDAETTTHYNYFRDYDPSIGRFTESDPIGLNGGINTYGYVGANPVARTDPDGRQVLLPPPPIVVPIPPPGIPGLPGTPPPVFQIPAFPAPNPITLCLISPAICAMQGIMNMVGQACSPEDRRPKCDQQAARDEDSCRLMTLPGTGARSRCWTSVIDRHNQCMAGRELTPLVVW
jgi:RHS repeat-associated protein